MTTQNFLIGPVKDGIRKDIKPWATPEDSFEKLINAYQWRGRILRRPGYTALDSRFTTSRLSFQISLQIVGASAQNFTANLFTVFSLTSVMIVPEFTTITVNGGANYTLSEDPNNPGSIVQISGAGINYLNGSINYLTGSLALNFLANPGGNVVISFSYAYGLPVMGLRTRELFGLNQQDTIAFDTTYAYRYSNTSAQFQPLPSVMPVTWNGTDYQFFFTTNYAGAFWATNSVPGLNGFAISNVSFVGTLVTVTTTATNGFVTGQSVAIINVGGITGINGNTYVITVTGANSFTFVATVAPTGVYTVGGMALNSQVTVTGEDGIRYYGALTNGTGWANYNPPVDPNNVLAGALLIFPYRGYLVFLNTTEGNEAGVFNYGNRARWTQIGTPYYSEPVPQTPNIQGVDMNAARDDLFGRGGANDAPTQEVIIGAAFIRDILIVYFERSSWRLRFVNNAQNPFVWERINVELGASATFSTIPFNKGLMAIGERGIVISDANDTNRIDEKIPDEIFDIRIENNGMERVYGIRTFRTKLNYWTFPSDQNPNGTFPDQVLVLNNDTMNWAIFDDCFTCFGYFYSFDDQTWADLTLPWSSYGNITWGGGEIEQGYETIIAGNQQGFVFKLEQTDSENSPSLVISSITNGTPSIFTSPDNNLPDGSWIKLSGIAGVTDVSGVTLNGRSFKVVNIGGPAGQPNTFSLLEFTPYAAGLATGSSFNFTLSSPFIPVFPGSVYITVGALTFTDPGLNGVLTATGSLSTGVIDYSTGAITLFFVPALGAPTQVYIRVVSVNPEQGFSNVETTGTYTGGGYLTKISNINIQSKIFNFLPQDQRSRLSKIDFYVDTTSAGEFTCNVLSDSSDVVINTPLRDNLRSNVVQTTLNPYQAGNGTETIYRLYCDAIAQTLQVQLTLSDQQMAVQDITNSNIEILAMNFSIRSAGRLV